MNIEKFPYSKSAKRMMGYITGNGWYDNSWVGKWIFEVMGREMDELFNYIDELPYQAFPETATWGLKYHEIKWSLPVKKELSIEERRKLVCKKRDFRAPMTPYRMEKYLEGISDFKVMIADVHDPGDYGWIPEHPNIFKVYFIGKGTVNSKLAGELLDRIKQSHTEYVINHRIDYQIDNSELEQIRVKNIHFLIAFLFWGWDEYIYDGSIPYEGLILYNQKLRYRLLIAIKYKLGSVYTNELFRSGNIIFKMPILNKISINTATSFCYKICFWGTFLYNGWFDYDGRIDYSAKRNYCLGARISFFLKAFLNEKIDSPVHIQIIRINENQEIAAALKDSIKIYFFNPMVYDGTWLYDGFHEYSEKRYIVKVGITTHLKHNLAGKEKMSDLVIISKTKDYTLYDGNRAYDGVKKYNSIYKKEVA